VEEMAFRKPERELSAIEILDLSLSLYFARFELFLFPFLFTSVFNGLVSYFLLSLAPVFKLPPTITEESITWLLNYLAAIAPLIATSAIIGWVINTMANGVVVKSSSELLEGRRASINIGLSSILSSLASLLAAGFVVAVLTVLGLILFIVPGVIMTIMFSLTIQVIIIERLGVSAGLWRSRKLVARRWLKTLTIIFLVFMLMLMSSVIGRIIGNSVASYNSGLSLLIQSIVSSLALPLQPITLTLLYYSLRAREKPVEQVMPPQIISPFRAPAPRPSPQMPPFFQPKFCYKCGQGIPSDAIFCPRCGVRVRPE
jgi:uncharacterized membrane protein